MFVLLYFRHLMESNSTQEVLCRVQVSKEVMKNKELWEIILK